MSKQSAENQSQILVLIRKAQAGDEAAVAELFERYAALIYAGYRPYLQFAPSEEELRSEVMVAFWNAINRYDTEKKDVTFGLYAQICIKNRLVSCMRNWSKRRRPISLDDDAVGELQAADSSNPANYVVEQEQYDRLLSLIEQVLSDGERRVWLRFVAGRSAAEIAEELGKDKKAVENAIFRARRKLRQALPDAH